MQDAAPAEPPQRAGPLHPTHEEPGGSPRTTAPYLASGCPAPLATGASREPRSSRAGLPPRSSSCRPRGRAAPAPAALPPPLRLPRPPPPSKSRAEPGGARLGACTALVTTLLRLLLDPNAVRPEHHHSSFAVLAGSAARTPGLGSRTRGKLSGSVKNGYGRGEIPGSPLLSPRSSSVLPQAETEGGCAGTRELLDPRPELPRLPSHQPRTARGPHGSPPSAALQAQRDFAGQKTGLNAQSTKPGARDVLSVPPGPLTCLAPLWTSCSTPLLPHAECTGNAYPH